MSDGPMLGRFRLSTFVVTERRTTVYDGSHREDNPLNERTPITVPIVSLDFRVTPLFGIQGSTTIPLIARTGVVPRASGDVPFRDEVGAWAIPFSAAETMVDHHTRGIGRSTRRSHPNGRDTRAALPLRTRQRQSGAPVTAATRQRHGRSDVWCRGRSSLTVAVGSAALRLGPSRRE